MSSDGEDLSSAESRGFTNLDSFVPAPARYNDAVERSVLVVDDDAELCQLLSEYLSTEGYAVEAVHTGRQGVERALSDEHAIVVLDVMLPDLKGFEVLRRVRAQSRMPILMLTARGDEQDRILGLEMGADDYLAKPFNPRELSARIEAVLRRSRPEASALAPIRRRSDRRRRRVGGQGRARRQTRRRRDRADDRRIRSARPAAARGRTRHPARRDGADRAAAGIFPLRSQHRHAREQPARKLGPAPDGSERIKGVRGIGYQYALQRAVAGSR